jgi:hypothetical protein
VLWVLIAADLDAWVPGRSPNERGGAGVRGGQDGGAGLIAVGTDGGSIVTGSLEAGRILQRRPGGWSKACRAAAGLGATPG